jgi:hypothetical protein
VLAVFELSLLVLRERDARSVRHALGEKLGPAQPEDT